MREEKPIIDYAANPQPYHSIWDGGWLVFLLYCATVLGLVIIVAVVVSLLAFW